MSRYHILLKAANVAALILALSINVYFSSEHKKHSEGNITTSIHNNKTYPSTHILPAGYTFGIWGLINTLLVGFVIYQWFEPANDVTVDGIRYYHVVVNVLNATWLIIWENGYPLIDTFVIAALLAVLFLIYRNLSFYPPQNLADRLFIHYPFTIYPAWILIATILNVWVAVSALDTELFSAIIIIVIGLVGLCFVDFKHDIVFATTLAWSLVGIAVRQHETLPVLVSASISTGLILGSILREGIALCCSRHRDSVNERTHLLSP
ncbi:7210_t:CDS:2 [Acaulospora morrowiae]|uniref:7210_t:CDS:1 n=1 Tax=Acaulospora morrowiae TaxID=94023 RepID=A0A9N9FKA0_9GLOM|nr:7210_t:CDS:2 [Acaulospora morrowiae]